MMTQNISFYEKVSDIKSQSSIPLDIFLEGVRTGKWQDLVLPIRTLTDKKKREEAKKKIPSVTISGKFSERADNALEAHSGYIAIDIDNCENPEEYKQIICADRYVAAAFTSVSGRGLCLLFKINPDKHRLAHDGILEYLYTTYGIIADPTSVNLSRCRFVSYDPHLYLADRAEKFVQYPKVKEPKKIARAIYDNSDFEQILKQIMDGGVNICDDYNTWMRIGFSLAHKFGEQGREYFHMVSSVSGKYEAKSADKQYDAIMKRQGARGGRDITISTFYYYAKQAGLVLYSERTRIAAHSAAHGKKGGLKQEQVVANLAKFEDIHDAEEIVKQVFEGNIELNEDTLLDELEIWMRQNYLLKRNSITRYIECDGVPMQQEDFNTIYIKAKKIFEQLSFDLIDRLIRSKFVPTYNPFMVWLAEHAEVEVTGEAIDAFFSTIKTKDQQYLKYFGRKWLVSIIAAMHGEHSPLVLVLSGDKHGTGKTEWFRRMLPPDLRHYYAESKLDAGKDDEILMTQKLVIMDDEMGGKSKKEAKRLKELTSKQVFTLREPYGRNNVDLVRLAVLCGTTNDNEVLYDPTGNRRIIPVQVISIDQSLYNSVDKTQLIVEAYKLWQSGYDWRVIGEDITYLGQDAAHFEVSSLEAELLQRFFEPSAGGTWQSATDIKVRLEQLTNQKLMLDRVGKELKRLGYDQKIVRVGTSTKRVYAAIEVAGANGPGTPSQKFEKIETEEDLPF